MTRDASDQSERPVAGAEQSHAPLRREPVVIPSPGKHETSHHQPDTVRRVRGKKIKGKAMKVIRRLHLYTGLILLPWVLLFGISGFLFNHKTLLRKTPPTTVTRFEQPDVQRELGFGAVDPQTLARQVVAQLNEQLDTQAQSSVNKASAGKPAGRDQLTLRDQMALDDSYPAAFKGILSLTSKNKTDVRTFTMDLNDGSAMVTQIPAPVERISQMTPAPFAGQRVHVASLPMDGLSDHVGELAAKSGIDPNGPNATWSMGRKNHGPELRFKVLDAAGRQWHVIYDTTSGKLVGRAADELPETDFREIITSLHKQHHYPTEFGIPWIWILIADCLALMMVFWGLSGLVMWWQLKPTRTIGLVVVLVMSAVGYMVICGALDNLYFVHD